MSSDDPIKVRFELPASIRDRVVWAWELFASHFGIPYRMLDEGRADIRIAMEPDGDVPVSQAFEGAMRKGMLRWEELMPEEPAIKCSDGRTDVLSTAFYMVNSLQERSAFDHEKDAYGRFRSDASYQARFGVFERDIVSELFDELYERCFQNMGLSPFKGSPSHIFLTHDIDRVANGDLREAGWSVKKGKILRAIRLGIDRAMGKYEWENIREILSIHERYGLTSCFFWLPEKGKDELGIPNADHDVTRPRFQDLMREIEARGSYNGLHKSSFDRSFQDEFSKLRSALPINRNHYLKIHLPEHYESLEDEGFLLDSSLGFSDAIGFRNSYGRPFHPFDQRSGAKMRLLEVPLQIMDTALLRLGSDPFERMRSFLDRNTRNKVITILWHNNFFSDGRFRYWREHYLRLLQLLKEREMRTFDPKEAIRSLSASP